MNSLIEEEFPLAITQRLRYDLLGILTDSDLAYQLPGDNPTLGALCREIGDAEYSYIRSFASFKHEWLRDGGAAPGLETSVARLREWYAALDADFETVVRGFSDEDLHSKRVDRGGGFAPSLFVQFQIYREALLIFFAKASVYVKALGKRVNEEWEIGIG
ncbi:MAG TPA: DinB family protein [Herpetosiphonaceae bacterium]